MPSKGAYPTAVSYLLHGRGMQLLRPLLLRRQVLLRVAQLSAQRRQLHGVLVVPRLAGGLGVDQVALAGGLQLRA